MEAIDFARDRGIVSLTIPPHTSHKLQPLGKSCYGPFKTAFNKAMDNWLRTNPGKTVTIYDIPEITNEAYTQTFTARNITADFQSTGIYPYNSELFTEVDFAPSIVTDTEDPQLHEGEVRYEIADDEPEQPALQESDAVQPTSQTLTLTTPYAARLTSPIAGNSDANASDQNLQQPRTPDNMFQGLKTTGYVSPMDIEPTPKAGTRKNVTNNRGRKKTTILTDSPWRNATAALKRERGKKKLGRDKKKEAPKRRLFDDRAFENDSESDISLADILERDNEEINVEMNVVENDELILDDVGSVRMSQYVVCEFSKKAHKCYNVGRVVREVDEEGDIEVDFLRRKGYYLLSLQLKISVQCTCLL